MEVEEAILREEATDEWGVDASKSAGSSVSSSSSALAAAAAIAASSGGNMGLTTPKREVTPNKLSIKVNS